MNNGKPLEQNMFKRLNNYYATLPVFTYNGKDKEKIRIM